MQRVVKKEAVPMQLVVKGEAVLCINLVEAPKQFWKKRRSEQRRVDGKDGADVLFIRIVCS